MKLYNLVLIFIALSAVSCKHFDESDINQVRTKNQVRSDISFEIDSVRFDGEGMTVEYQISATYRDDDEALLYYEYDVQNHSLNKFSIDQKKKIFGKKLTKEGPGSVGGINALFVSSKDSIFLYSANLSILYLLNSKFEITRVWNMNGKDMVNERFFTENSLVITQPQDAFHYNRQDSSVYIRSSSQKISYTKKPEMYFNNNKLIAKYNIFTNKIDLLNISYSDELKSNFSGFLSNCNSTFITKNDDLKIVYNFAANAEIFVYQKKNNQTTSYIPDKRPVNLHMDYMSWAKSTDSDFQFKSLLNNVNYDGVTAIYGGKYFYQFCQDKTEPNNVRLRKSYLMIFDANFNLISTMQMPKNLVAFTKKTFFDKNALFVPFYGEENMLNFLTIKINNIK